MRAFRTIALVVVAVVASVNTLAWLWPCSTHASAASTPDACCGGAARANDEVVDAGVPALEPSTSHDDDGDDDCSCPVKCGNGCSGAPSSSVAVLPTLVPSVVPVDRVLSFVSDSGRPARGQSFDVLHVPIA